MPETITLKGCTPEPLSNYLKALGVLRLVVEQKQDPQAKGYWHNDAFILVTNLTQDDLETFFLHRYKPTPLVAPWNGSTGFYPKDTAQKRLLSAIQRAKTDRFQVYGETIATAQEQVNALRLTVQPKEKDEKRRLLERLRNTLPDEAVKWLDTCALVTSDDLKFPPLTGTGGNDGNFEFSRTFMQQLQELIDFATGEPNDTAAALLQAAVFGATLPALPFSGKIGQFNPIAAGGANAAPGYDADSRVNPWDFVLMLEGIMLFTAGATRRYEQSDQGGFAYPFTVRPSNVGYGSAAEGDEARAELWTPLWSAPTGLKELQLLFSEGRAKVGDRTARYGIDFYRAVSNLGRDRGIDEFVRYSFQVRNGLSYFAIPLDRFQPKPNPQVDWLTEIDPWLDRFRRAAQDSNAPASIKRTQRQLETAIIDLSRKKATLLNVLIALGEAEAALDRSLKFAQEKFLRPLPLLKHGWVDACKNDSTEFRLGLALASNNLRPRLVRARPTQPYYWDWADNEDGITTWENGDLASNLIAVLKREEIESQLREKKDERENQFTEHISLYKPFTDLDDIVRWINRDVNDERVEAIARGLSLVDLSKSFRLSEPPELPIPAAYALTTITHHRHLLREACQKVFGHYILGQDLTLPRVPALLTKLAAGDCYTATQLAIRRLYASGLEPALSEGVYEPRDRTLRIASALAFPISNLDLARLLKQIRKHDPKE
ncbi:type I-U CRISPR-associated protein Csx17 [Leptolyngbya sp. FACHB-8]|uniref:type I-G CRISPR-associated protein Cas8g1/Csx17 n=1 Tax=unclassified Leptolyngbya TaxID=2650499 RepID=UPI00168629C0|nr:type I-U CRISPR-associated protein Csx17 [Leptolyngbya sp. FACHB-8]MBD1911252.1 type I-U CRISPR-associated protein Csx17 [Leptolyngbya sp. FACHB-8]